MTWIFDLETESGVLCAGVGRLVVHNSPRRGLEFVTRKITWHAAAIKLGLVDKLHLGNLDAERDWGYAKDYVEAMWLMLQQDDAEDYVIATGVAHSVRDCLEIAFDQAGVSTDDHVVIDDSLRRPAEVDHLIGDASKARRRARMGAKDPLRAADPADGRCRPETAPRRRCAARVRVSSRRALITGITGQDGSFLSEILLQKGYAVIGAVRREPAAPLGCAEHLRGQVELIRADLLEPRSLADAVAKLRPQELYHLAAPSFVPDSWRPPGKTLAAIAAATAALLEAVRDHSPRHVCSSPAPGRCSATRRRARRTRTPSSPSWRSSMSA